MNLNIELVCLHCERKMILKSYYKDDPNPYAFVVIPCKCGIDYKKYVALKKEAEKEALRIAKLPHVSVFGDHHTTTR